MNKFCQRLKFAMDTNKMKSIDLANKLNINKGIISNYLNDKYKPKFDRINEIAIILNVNEAWLMGYDVPMERDKAITNVQLDKEHTLDKIILDKTINLTEDKKKLLIDIIDNLK